MCEYADVRMCKLFLSWLGYYPEPVMKKILQTLLICLITQFAFSQSFPKKQTLMPLSNVNGVPFYKDPELNDLVVNGFEVDPKGNFYFFGGKSPRLAVFNGTKQVYRKTYKELSSGTELHPFKGYFYNFGFDPKGQLIFIKINMINGALANISNPLISKHFNSYSIVDSCIILRASTENPAADIFEKYDLSGKYIGKVSNEYNVVPKILPEKDADLLGMWNGNYVFYDLVDDSKLQKFWLVNQAGKILATKAIANNNSLFGRGYAEEPLEHRKVRNGNLYVLGRSQKGNNALITEVPLQTFFYK